jgi:hypothetical protein
MEYPCYHEKGQLINEPLLGDWIRVYLRFDDKALSRVPLTPGSFPFSQKFLATRITLSQMLGRDYSSYPISLELLNS